MTSPLIANQKIAIIGGGPVGLTTALLLQQKGANVTLYERDASLQTRITGGSIDLHQHTGQAALKEAGLLDAFYQIARPTAERMLTREGEIFREELVQQETKYFKPEVDRNDLRHLLCSHLRPGVVVWNRKLVALERLPQGPYQLHFEGNIIETADLVIGANGGMSSVRSLITDARPLYTGTYMIQGEVANPALECPNFVKLCQDGNAMATEGGHVVATHYIAKGVLVFYVSFRQAEDWFAQNGLDVTDKAVMTAFLEKTFESWSPAYHELFRAGSVFKGLPIRYVPLDIPWREHHQITLIGDAAHVMPPFAGVGVNTGLVDALTLTTNLTNGEFDSIDAAITDYESQMFVYAKEALQASLSGEKNIHAAEDLASTWQSRTDWNQHLADADQQPLGLVTSLKNFKARALSANRLGGRLKFVIGESQLLIDGRGKTNVVMPAVSLVDCTITMSPPIFQGLLDGQLSTLSAFTGGRLKVAGDMGLAMKARALFE